MHFIQRYQQYANVDHIYRNCMFMYSHWHGNSSNCSRSLWKWRCCPLRLACLLMYKLWIINSIPLSKMVLEILINEGVYQRIWIHIGVMQNIVILESSLVQILFQYLYTHLWIISLHISVLIHTRTCSQHTVLHLEGFKWSGKCNVNFLLIASPFHKHPYKHPGVSLITQSSLMWAVLISNKAPTTSLKLGLRQHVDIIALNPSGQCLSDSSLGRNPLCTTKLMCCISEYPTNGFSREQISHSKIAYEKMSTDKLYLFRRATSCHCIFMITQEYVRR